MRALLRDYQALAAWGLLAGFLLVLLGLVGLPLASLDDRLERRIENQALQIARYQALVRTADRVEAEVARVEKQGLDKLFFAADQTPALVATRLQKELTGTIKRHGGQLLSSKTLQSESSGRLTVVRTSLSIQGGLGTVRQLVATVERMRPVVLIDRLELDYRGRRDWDKDDNVPQRLTIDVDLKAFIYRGEAE